MLRSFKILFTLGLPVFLIACQGDYENPICGGYSLLRSNSEMHCILDPNETVAVGPNVEWIGNSKDVIYGLTADFPGSVEYPENLKFGYFIVVPKSQFISMGLTRDAWLAELVRYGITAEPPMRKPRR